MKRFFVCVAVLAFLGCGAISGGPSTGSGPFDEAGGGIDGAGGGIDGAGPDLSDLSPDGGSPGDAGHGAGATGESCGRYLSCLRVTSPEAYAAASELYGADAACWKTARQAERCRQACETAFLKIGGQCQCAGSECTKCDDLPRSVYKTEEPNLAMLCDDGGELEISWIQLNLWHGGGDRLVVATFIVWPYDGAAIPVLEGTAACRAPFSLTGETTRGFPLENWHVTLTPTGKGTSADVEFTRKTTFEGGKTRTCSLTTKLSSLP
jgi:hypothetical protein